MWKFKSWKGKDKWLYLLTVGVIFCILAFPVERVFGGGGRGKEADGKAGTMEEAGAGQYGAGAFANDRKNGTDSFSDTGELTGTVGASDMGQDAWQASARTVDSYEAELEQRIKALLRHVDGVGEVDVMVVLESSAERVWQSDGSTSTSLTEETDSGGGSRRIESREMDHSTVLVSGDGKSEPMLTKELRPQISGIIISAAGGGSPQIQAEISSAMEALLGLPAHKIKVLKRVE